MHPPAPEARSTRPLPGVMRRSWQAHADSLDRRPRSAEALEHGRPPRRPGQDGTLGAAIRARRLELGLTQEQLAERVGDGVRQADISRLERGGVDLPRRDRLAAIGRALRLPLGELLVRSGWSGADGAFVVSESDDAPDPFAPPRYRVEHRTDDLAALIVGFADDRAGAQAAASLHAARCAAEGIGGRLLVVDQETEAVVATLPAQAPNPLTGVGRSERPALAG